MFYLEELQNLEVMVYVAAELYAHTTICEVMFRLMIGLKYICSEKR